MSARSAAPRPMWGDPERAWPLLETRLQHIDAGHGCLLASADATDPDIFKFIAWALGRELDLLRAEIRLALSLPAEQVQS